VSFFSGSGAAVFVEHGRGAFAERRRKRLETVLLKSRLTR
jgi:hypothetical protein